MKRIAICILLGALLLLPACGATEEETVPDTSAPAATTTELITESGTVMENSEMSTSTTNTNKATAGTAPTHGTLPFTVGFQVNTHGYVGGGREGGAILVRSQQALDAFYGNDPDGNKHLYQASLAKYDDAFFESKALLLIIRQEPSGSNRLQVRDVALANGRLVVRVSRTMPGIGTMDMARWVIAIELDNKLLPAGDVPVDVTYH